MTDIPDDGLDVTEHRAPRDTTAEQRIFELLNYEFNNLKDEDGSEIVDADGASSFLIVGFNKPSDPATFARSNDRLHKVQAVGVTLMLCCPDVETDTDSLVTLAEAQRHGIHVVATTILSQLLRTYGLAHVVNAAQEMVGEREAKLNA